MATQNDNGIRSFTFASAITANTLVSVSGTNAAQAASTGASAIGVVQNDTAAGIVTAGSSVFAVTNGTIVGTLAASAATLGVAINSGVAGDVVEYVPKFNQ